MANSWIGSFNAHDWTCNSTALLTNVIKVAKNYFFWLNNNEGKVTECRLVNEESGFFFFIFLAKRAKLLAHDWSSEPLATAYANEKYFLYIKNGVSFRDN